jgi:hypothetical protein
VTVSHHCRTPRIAWPRLRRGTPYPDRSGGMEPTRFTRTEIQLSHAQGGRGWTASIHFDGWRGNPNTALDLDTDFMMYQGTISTKYLQPNPTSAISDTIRVSDGLGIPASDAFRLTVPYDEDDEPIGGQHVLSVAKKEAELRGWPGPDDFVSHTRRLEPQSAPFPSQLAVSSLVLDYGWSRLSESGRSYGWVVRGAIISRPFAARDAVDMDLRTMLYRTTPGEAISALREGLNVLHLPFLEGASLLVERDGHAPEEPLPPNWRALVGAEARRQGLDTYPP